VVRTQSGRGTTSEENASPQRSASSQEHHSRYSTPSYEYRSDPDVERPESEERLSRSSGSDNWQTTDDEEEIPPGLTSSTHPFFRGEQYPPQPPLVPPENIELPPSLPSTLSTLTPSESLSSMSVPPAAAAPTPKEKGRRPDPFTKKSEYEKFHQQLSIFFRMNTAVYTTEIEKIYFTLSLMTEGTPGQWAQNFVDKVEAQAVTGVIPDAAWGTWAQFVAALKKSFEDPNKKRTSNYALEDLMFSPGQTADEFLQEFETLAGRAGYMGANQDDSRLIVLLEKKVPLRILDRVYSDVLPVTYDDYKDKILRYDDLNQKLKAIVPKTKGKFRFISHSGNTYTTTPTGIKVEPAEIGRNRPKSKKLWTPQSSTNRPSTSKPSTSKKPDLSNVTCYGCGRKGHMVADCRDTKGKEKGQQLRAFIDDLDNVEKKAMMDFLRV
jgi:hypothetical protein